MNVDHKTTKIRRERNRILSAQAPMMSAGVIAANFNWNAKNNNSGIFGAYELTLFTPTLVNPAKDKLPMTPLKLGPYTRL
jgi:hypothetical protein